MRRCECADRRVQISSIANSHCGRGLFAQIRLRHCQRVVGRYGSRARPHSEVICECGADAVSIQREIDGPLQVDAKRSQHMSFVLRTSGEPMALVESVKRAVADVDLSRPATNFRTVEQFLNQQTQYLRLYILLLGIFGGIAAVLAAIGIYGIM